jgi:hypothetical protein
VPPFSLGTGTSSPVALPTPTVKIFTPFFAAACAAVMPSPSRSSPSVMSTRIFSAAVRVFKTASDSRIAAAMFVPPRGITFTSSASSDSRKAS